MRGATIQIGAGALFAGIIGFWNDAAAFAFLIAVGVILIGHGVYDDLIKPRFRVDQRLADWLIRRGWKVGIERRPQFNFLLHLTSGSSEKEVFVTRDKEARDDLLAFTGKVSYHPTWFEILSKFSQEEQERLTSDIRIYLTAKDLSCNMATTDFHIWPRSCGSRNRAVKVSRSATCDGVPNAGERRTPESCLGAVRA